MTISSTDQPPPPAFVTQGMTGHMYPTHPQGMLHPGQVTSGGPSPSAYPQALAPPMPQGQPIAGQYGYYYPTPHYAFAPPPQAPAQQSSLNVPRRRSTSTTSSTRSRGERQSRRLTAESGTYGLHPRQIDRAVTQPVTRDPSRTLPSPFTEPRLPRLDTAPASLPPLPQISSQPVGYYHFHPYPSPPLNVVRLPEIKEPNRGDTPPPSEPRPSASPRPGSLATNTTGEPTEDKGKDDTKIEEV